MEGASVEQDHPIPQDFVYNASEHEPRIERIAKTNLIAPDSDWTVLKNVIKYRIDVNIESYLGPTKSYPSPERKDLVPSDTIDPGSSTQHPTSSSAVKETADLSNGSESTQTGAEARESEKEDKEGDNDVGSKMGEDREVKGGDLVHEGDGTRGEKDGGGSEEEKGKETPGKGETLEELTQRVEIREGKKRVFEMLDGFEREPPFTIQRLSELSLSPRPHYSSPIKYIRALQRVLLVTSTYESFPMDTYNLPTSTSTSSDQPESPNGIPEPSSSDASNVPPTNVVTVNGRRRRASSASQGGGGSGRIGAGGGYGYTSNPPSPALASLLSPIPFLQDRDDNDNDDFDDDLDLNVSGLDGDDMDREREVEQAKRRRLGDEEDDGRRHEMGQTRRPSSPTSPSSSSPLPHIAPTTSTTTTNVAATASTTTTTTTTSSAANPLSPTFGRVDELDGPTGTGDLAVPVPLTSTTTATTTTTPTPNSSLSAESSGLGLGLRTGLGTPGMAREGTGEGLRGALGPGSALSLGDRFVKGVDEDVSGAGTGMGRDGLGKVEEGGKGGAGEERMDVDLDLGEVTVASESGEVKGERESGGSAAEGEGMRGGGENDIKMEVDRE